MDGVTKTAEETKTLGQKLASSLKPGDVVCLYGDLGSGKTTFTQGLARGLGLKILLTSPTFILLRHYPLPNKSLTLYHIDLYRLENEHEIKELGLPTLFTDNNAITVIEWAEKAKNLLPKKRIDVFFSYTDENTRSIYTKKIHNS